MSIRSQADVILAVNNYGDLMRRIHKLLAIYKKTRILTIPRYSYLKVDEICEDNIVVSLHRIKQTEHTHMEPVYSEVAGPPGLGIGWEPDAEDVVGEREVFDSYSYAMIEVFQLTIPSTDIGIVDDSELANVEQRCRATVKQREAEAARKKLESDIQTAKGNLADMQKKLEGMK